MEQACGARVVDDFEYLVSFLPAGWEAMAASSGAVKRYRGFKDAKTLLRVMAIHLAEGLSLKETAALSKHGGLVDVSAVTIMERLRQSGEWFRELSMAVMSKWFAGTACPLAGESRRVRMVDATRVKEMGPTGTTWNMHYSLCLGTLRCNEFHVTDRKGGETFKRFAVEPGDILIGDRAYGVRPGVAHVIRNQGDVVVRINLKNMPLLSAGGDGSFDLLSHLRGLDGCAAGDWDVAFDHEGRRFHGRVCAVRKSPLAIRQAKARLARRGQKNGEKVSWETAEVAEYVVVFTSLSRDAYNGEAVLELYRGRWQVELVFKRLKSLMRFGHLPKTDERSILGWLQGKLLMAFLVEALTSKGEAFSPWGYQLRA